MSALAGLRVLEIAEGAGPPIAAMHLADHGADVVKVERPGGDPARRQAGFAVWNRGKRSVTVDAAKTDDIAWLCAQVRGADVCILGEGESLAAWSPAVAEAAKENRRLILARMPAYLGEGTPWAGGAESHGLLAAALGLGWRQSSIDGGPVDPISPHILGIHGLWGAACVLAAVFERGDDGWGQEVAVTGVHALMEAMIQPLCVDPHAPDPASNIGSFGRHPTYRCYQARDGGWVASGALGARFETTLLGLLGATDILEDPRVAGDVDRLKHPDLLDWAMERVAAAFMKRPQAEWLELMTQAGIPCGPISPRESLMDHPQIAAIGMRVQVEDPERGAVVMPGVPINLTASPGKVAGPAPTLGQHNGAAPWPAQPEPEGRRRYRVGPLSGVKVLNLGTFVATPYAGMLLSELGADVVKVEALTGDPFRVNGYPHNRGMRSLSVDMGRDEGREIFRTLSRTADVVIDGMRPGVMRRMGIDHEALEAANPGVVTMSLSAFGEHGAMARLPGVDMVVQGVSGLMTAQGAPNAPVVSTVAYIDVATASMSVLACLLALIDRRRTGRGQHVWDSLLGTATYLQAAELVRFEGRTPPRQGSEDFRGSEWFNRYYAASDGWVRLDASRDPDAALAALMGSGLVAGDPEQSLAGWIAALAVDDAVAQLNALGVPAVRTRKVSQLFTDAELLASEFAHFRNGADGSLMSTPGRYAAFSRTQRWGPMFPPGIGQHSREVLAQAGWADEDVQPLLDDGLVKQGGPMIARFGTTYR